MTGDLVVKKNIKAAEWNEGYNSFQLGRCVE